MLQSWSGCHISHMKTKWPTSTIKSTSTHSVASCLKASTTNSAATHRSLAPPSICANALLCVAFYRLQAVAVVDGLPLLLLQYYFSIFFFALADFCCRGGTLSFIRLSINVIIAFLYTPLLPLGAAAALLALSYVKNCISAPQSQRYMCTLLFMHTNINSNADAYVFVLMLQLKRVAFAMVVFFLFLLLPPDSLWNFPCSPFNTPSLA